MNKLLAALAAGLLAVGAHAQNPSGTTPEQGNATNSAGQQAAQAKRDAKPHGAVAQAGGDINKTPEAGVVTTPKAAAAAEKRVKARAERRRNKDGSPKRATTQGGTPK